MDIVDKAICIRLMGGLGNQLFQYAFGQRLNSEGIKVFYDVENGFRYDPYLRKYALDAFDIEVTPASSDMIPIGMSWRHPFHHIPRFFCMLSPRSRQSIFYEQSPFEFDPEALRKSDTYKYYFGYWQSPLYSNAIKSTLRLKLRLKDLSTTFLNMQKKIRDSISISVHVRRYNDLNKRGRVITSARQVHGSCNAAFYKRAIEYLPWQSGMTAYLFTDDINWCKENIELNIPTQYISDSGDYTDSEELMLMATCSHHIISNSTFSWWGAWLGENNLKTVIAPRIWNKCITGNQMTICPSEWIRI